MIPYACMYPELGCTATKANSSHSIHEVREEEDQSADSVVDSAAIAVLDSTQKCADVCRNCQSDEQKLLGAFLEAPVS